MLGARDADCVNEGQIHGAIKETVVASSVALLKNVAHRRTPRSGPSAFFALSHSTVAVDIVNIIGVDITIGGCQPGTRPRAGISELDVRGFADGQHDGRYDG